MDEKPRRSLEERLAASEARTRKLREAVAKQKRRLETQRKIVMGAMVLAGAESGNETAVAAAQQSYGQMRKRDRTLFAEDPWRTRETDTQEDQGEDDAPA